MRTAAIVCCAGVIGIGLAGGVATTGAKAGPPPTAPAAQVGESMFQDMVNTLPLIGLAAMVALGGALAVRKAPRRLL